MNYNNSELKVLCIHHADMDGVASAIVLKNFYKTVYTVAVTYQTEIYLLDNIKEFENKYDVIICVDFFPIKMINELNKICPVLVLDHHESAEKFNDGKTIIINTTMSATKLVYKFISNYKNISYLEQFVNIVDDWDMYTLKIPSSIYFNDMYWEMGPKWFLRRFINGNISLYPEEKQYFIDAKKEFALMYNTLEVFNLSRNGVFFEAAKFHHECIEALKKEGYKWFVIKNKYNLSLRCDDINLIDICNKLNRGGGHIHSVGIPLYKNDNIKEIITKINYYIDDYYMNMIDD